MPQIQVTLQLQCAGEETNNDINSNTSKDIGIQAFPIDSRKKMRYSQTIYSLPRTIAPGTVDGRWMVLTDDIDYNASLTMLTIIIEDENDNSPIFVAPFAHVIGYPEAAVAARILPSKVCQVQAVDRDAGLNAIIQYSFESDSINFNIHSVSGIITPQRDAFASTESEAVVVLATDRNGATEGSRTTRLNLTLKKLETRHIAVINIERASLDVDVEYILGNIYDMTELDLMLLHASIISLDASSSSSEDIKASRAGISALRMFVYSIDTANEFIDSMEILKYIFLTQYYFSHINLFTLCFRFSHLNSFISEIYIMDSKTYEDAYARDVDIIEKDSVALIIVASVLGVALLLTASGAFAMWWFMIHPYEFRESDENGSTVSSMMHVLRRSHSPPQPILKSNKFVDVGDFDLEKKESLTLKGTTLKGIPYNLWRVCFKV